MSELLHDTSVAADVADTPRRPRLLSLRGRLGRAHYIAYSLGAIVVALLFMYLFALMMLLSGSVGRMLYIVVSVLVFYCLLPVLFTVLTIKRAHDFNVGGWLALLLLVPVVNLMFWFIPGTRDANRYGPVPAEPAGGVKLVAVLLPLLLVGGFLATGGPATYPPAGTAPATQPATSLQPYRP